MKYYKLLKDLPTFKAGEKFRLEDGNLYYYKSDNNKDAYWAGKIMAYKHKTLAKFPNILNDWFEEIEEEYKPWKPENGDRYFNIEDNSVIGQDVWSNSPYDNNLYKIGNCFKTGKEVEKALDWLEAFKVLRDDTKGYKFERGDYNYVVYYDSINDLFYNYVEYSDQYNIINFATEEDAEESIRKHEKEWRIFLGVEE